MINLGGFRLNVVSILLWISAGGLTSLWALGGPKWTVVGAVAASFAGVLAQSITTQAAPTRSIEIPKGSDAAPVINGDGTVVGKVTVANVLPHDKVTPV